MIYDLIIIGGGPAGISAGIYAGRAKLKTLVIEKENMGGQIKTTHEMVNYPGILQTTGIDYMDTLRQQALSFNVNFKEDEQLKTLNHSLVASCFNVFISLGYCINYSICMFTAI